MVKFEMDCGWVSAAGYNPATFLEKYPERIRLLHIKAFQAAPPNLNLVGPKEPKPAELGRGKPDYRPIFAAAERRKSSNITSSGTAVHRNVRARSRQSRLPLLARNAFLRRRLN